MKGELCHDELDLFFVGGGEDKIDGLVLLQEYTCGWEVGRDQMPGTSRGSCSKRKDINLKQVDRNAQEGGAMNTWGNCHQ